MLEIQVDGHQWVSVELFQNSFVSKWANLFEQTIETCSINQLESFSFLLTESTARQKLTLAIDHINSYLQKEFVPLPTSKSWEDFNWYNELHTKFENLNGLFGQPSLIFLSAPSEIKSSIRDLNFYTHCLEVRPYVQPRKWYMAFDKDLYQRRKLDDEDYTYFHHQLVQGTAYIHYCELGKSQFDIWKDQLPLDYAGCRNLHYYSAEIFIWLGPNIPMYPKEFYTWAESHGIDVHDKKSGLGAIPVGKLVDIDNAMHIAYNSSSITNLRINYGKTI